MTTPRQRERCDIGAVRGVYVLLLFLVVAAPARAQSLTERLAPLALDPDFASPPAGPLRCATPPVPMPWASAAFAADPSRANVAGDMAQLADGHPLYADQNPRFLQPDHTGTFGFDRLLVLGDYATVTFERVDADAENHHTAETWTRTRTDTVAGHLVSVFAPTWEAGVLRDVLRRYSWGVDSPRLYWGRLVVPGSGSDDGAGHDHVNVHLNIVPPNIPASEVVRIDDSVQYASHVVNVSDADFGDSRIQGGDTALDLPAITRLFYEHFADEYDVIAVVSQATQLAGYAGFHQVVRNAIAGLGLPLFDRSAMYGSAGVLQGVEGYPAGSWASWETVLHEQGHQYGEYTSVWAEAGSAAATTPAGASAIDRLGHYPDVHTPLLSPGAVTYGAVLDGHVRVAHATGADGAASGYEIEPTVPLVTYHPLTLYRMGLLPAASVSPIQVFVDQGQFEDDRSTAPDPDTEVSGATVEVSINDLLAADGVRSGPAATSVRRAIVYVSRGGLAPKFEMDVVNYFAQRLGESSGVTSWNRYPSFAEATGNRAVMTTAIRRSAAGATVPRGPSGRCARAGTEALVGIVLDDEVGGCLEAGSTVTVSGRLTLGDRSDYYAVCVRMRRYGAPDGDRIYVCDELNVDRFSLDVTFPADQTGGYTMEAFAFWPDAEAQFPLSTYTGAIEVVSAGGAAALSAP